MDYENFGDAVKSEFPDNKDRELIIKYLDYLQGRIAESAAYFEYIVEQTKKLDFDDETGAGIVEASDVVSKTMGVTVESFEKLAQAVDRLSRPDAQREVIINKVLKK